MRFVGAVVCGLVGLLASSAQAQSFRLLPSSSGGPSRTALEIRLAVGRPTWDLGWRLEPEAEYANGLPWELPRFTLFDAFSAEPFPGYRLTVGTVGEMFTSFDGDKELAGVRQLSPATFPGVRLRTPLLAPVEVGAGFLLAINRDFHPDHSWGVFELVGRL